MLYYWGGPVVTSQPHVVIAEWGSQWAQGDPSREIPTMQSFLRGIGTAGDTWSRILTQYYARVEVSSYRIETVWRRVLAHHGRHWFRHRARVRIRVRTTRAALKHIPYSHGVYFGTYVDTRAPAPQTATMSQVAAEAVRVRAHYPGVPSLIVVVATPPGTSNPIDIGYCAHHDNADPGRLDPRGQLWIHMPYVTDAGVRCYAGMLGGATDGITLSLSHEYAETLTDPTMFQRQAWVMLGPMNQIEIADDCTTLPGGDGIVRMATGAFPVSGLWSDEARGCVTS